MNITSGCQSAAASIIQSGLHVPYKIYCVGLYPNLQMVLCNFPCSLKQQHRITMTNEMWNILLCNFEGCSGILSQPFLIAHDRQTLHAPTRTNKRDYKMTQWCSNKHFHTTTVLYCCMATIPEHHPRGWLLHRPTESPPSLILRPQHPLSDLPIVSEVENYWLHGLWSCLHETPLGKAI